MELNKVRDNVEDALEKKCALIAIKRENLKKTIYTGAITLGLSIPLVVVDYIPLINNYVKNKDLTPRTLGEIGILVGSNIIITSAVRSFEHLQDIKYIERKIEEEKTKNNQSTARRKTKINFKGVRTDNSSTKFRD